MSVSLSGSKGEPIRTGDFEPQPPIDLLFEDLNRGFDTAGEVNFRYPRRSQPAKRSAPHGPGYGDEDMTVVIKALEATAGTELRDETE